MTSWTRAAGIAALLCGLAAAPAGAETPEVSAPESFDRPARVESSITRMQSTLAQMTEGNWKAQRARGVCQDAKRRLADYVTSQVYTPELGEKIWRECHKAYSDVE